MKKKYNNMINFLNNPEKMIVITVIISFFFLIFKQIISTYISSTLTLLPSVLIIILFVKLFLNKKIKFKKYDLFFFLMLLVGTISGLINDQNPIAIIYQIKSLSIYYFLYIILRSIKLKSSNVKMIMKYINVTTIIIVILSIIEVIFQKQFLFPNAWSPQIIYADNYIRAYSLIFNPNIYAFYLLFILIVNVKINKISMSYQNIIYNCLLITGIFLTVSRSAIICLLLIGCGYIIYMLKNRKQNNEKLIDTLKPVIIMITIIIVSMAVIFKSNSIYQNINDKESTSSVVEPSSSNSSSSIVDDDDNSHISSDTFIDRIIDMTKNSFLEKSLSNGRLAVLKIGFQIWEKNIFIGTGFSSFLTASSFIQPNQELVKLGLEYSDNQYMAILVETGLLGIISCIIFIVMLIKEFIKNNKNMSIILTLAFLFFGLFINVLEVQLTAFLYFLFISFDNKFDDNI